MFRAPSLRPSCALALFAALTVGCLNNPSKPPPDLDDDGGDLLDDGGRPDGSSRDVRPADARPDQVNPGDGNVDSSRDGTANEARPDGAPDLGACTGECTVGSKRCGSTGLQTCAANT